MVKAVVTAGVNGKVRNIATSGCNGARSAHTVVTGVGLGVIPEHADSNNADAAMTGQILNICVTLQLRDRDPNGARDDKGDDKSCGDNNTRAEHKDVRDAQ